MSSGLFSGASGLYGGTSLSWGYSGLWKGSPGLLKGVPGGSGPPIVPLNPTVMTASSFWQSTAPTKFTGADTGLNGASPPTAPATLYGSGYPHKIVAATTHTHRDVFTQDSDYVMFWGSGDWDLMSGFTLEVTYEGAFATFTEADCQWDVAQGIYGVPIAFRPYTGRSGIAKFYAVFKPTNGYARMLTGEIWHNRPGTTAYFDRDANATYVSGVDLNGSGAAGLDTNTGTSASPYLTIGKAQVAMTNASGKEGAYIYIKGNVFQDANATGTRNANVLPLEVRPWPGYTLTQTQVGKSDRTLNSTEAGSINWNCNFITFNGVQIFPDNIVTMFCGAAATSKIGMFNCVFTGTVNGGLDIYGYPKGICNGIYNTAKTLAANSQNFMQFSSGQRAWMKNCTGTIFCPNGFQNVVNCDIVFAWDTICHNQIAAGLTDCSYWNYKAYGGTQRAVSRFHYEEQLTVNTVVWDSVNGWSKITFSGSPTIIGNNFETYIQILTGVLGGTAPYGTQTVTALWPTGTGVTTGTCCIRATASLGGFPDTNTAYVKGVDLATLGLATGDLIRSYNHNHKDALQIIAASGGNKLNPVENYYFQSYVVVADDVQPFLNQTGAYGQTNISGTLTSVGTAVTTSQANAAIVVGQDFVLTSGAQSGQRREITAVNSTTSFTIASAFTVDQSVGVTARFEDIVTTVGTAMTCNASRIYRPTDIIHLAAGTQKDEYAVVLSGSAGTWTLSNAFSVNQTGVRISQGMAIKDFAMENCIVHKTNDGDYLGQWQQGAYNVSLNNCTFPGITAALDASITFRNQSGGYGMYGWAMRQSIVGLLKADSGFPMTGVAITRSHFMYGTNRATSGGTTGAPDFNSTGQVTSGYYPQAAAVQTVDVVRIKYDGKGAIRTVGSKVGARVA